MSAHGDTETVLILLAAGAGTRFDGPGHKLLATIDGRPVWEHAVKSALASQPQRLIVVTGAVALPQLDELAASDPRIVSVHNPNWANGQATSMSAGINTARAMNAQAVVIGLADQPGVTPEAWKRIAASSADLALADYGDRRGHPVRIARRHWNELPTDGDLGARDVLTTYASTVEAIPCKGSPDDIDTAKDLQRWLRRSPTSSP